MITSSQRPSLTWDIFCDVVDNFGDAAICWRLARQLARQYGQNIRLYCNNIAVLHNFSGTAPEPNISILDWNDATNASPSEIVVEAFACALPASYIQAMAVRPVKPIWINLEHLALERWSSECHALPSPHPQLLLTKYFFIPGFWPKTGGLIREKNLLSERDTFRADKTAQGTFWKNHHLPKPPDGVRIISIFAYENPALKDLFDTLAKAPRPTWCIVPEGRVTSDVTAWLGQGSLTVGTPETHGNLTIISTGFFSQDDYDRLLWMCDLNFVRGEDSIIRALWAGTPFIWAAYQQKDNAHFDKVAELLDVLTDGLSPSAGSVLRVAFEVWNGEKTDTGVWAQILARFSELEAHAGKTTAHLAETADCALQIMDFVGLQARLTTPPV